jgi:hypothetical protein
VFIIVSFGAPENRLSYLEGEYGWSVTVSAIPKPSISAAGLAEATERLRQSCTRLIWLNPLLRFSGFQPKSQGIRAMLPHVDDFRPVHNLESLRALIQTLSDPRTGQSRRMMVA